MATSLTVEACVDAVADAGARLGRQAEAAGLEADVPTCPDWDVAGLVAHQAMVHRWAAAMVRGDDARDPDIAPQDTVIRAKVDDLLGFYHEGVERLVGALRDAPDDLEAMTFLNDAPRPRLFWARRQAHETTVHMVDALAGALGRLPFAGEADIAPELAADGLDELLRGFFTRGRSKLFDGAERAVLVRPTDTDRSWRLRVAERLTVVDGGGDSDGDADVTLSGTAAQLYLGLWNRGEEIAAVGDPDVLERWRRTQNVRWTN